MSLSDTLKMTFTAFLWALCFPLIKVGLSHESSPLLFSALRSVIAGGALSIFAFYKRECVLNIWNQWLPLLLLGLSAYVAYYGMVLGGTKVSPGIGSIIGNSHPIMASILATIFLSESLNKKKIWGLVFGFIGVVLSVVPSFAGNSNNSLMGIALVLIGAFGTAAGNVLIKKFSKSQAPISILAIQFGISSALLFPTSYFLEGAREIIWSPQYIIALSVLALAGTALADIIWIDLLKRNSLTKLNIFIFLVPAFSLVMGIVFFQEKLGLWESFGIGSILIGVYMVLD